MEAGSVSPSLEPKFPLPASAFPYPNSTEAGKVAEFVEAGNNFGLNYTCLHKIYLPPVELG